MYNRDDQVMSTHLNNSTECFTLLVLFDFLLQQPAWLIIFIIFYYFCFVSLYFILLTYKLFIHICSNIRGRSQRVKAVLMS
jgi:hypothetical protein